MSADGIDCARSAPSRRRREEAQPLTSPSRWGTISDHCDKPDQFNNSQTWLRFHKYSLGRRP